MRTRILLLRDPDEYLIEDLVMTRFCTTHASKSRNLLNTLQFIPSLMPWSVTRDDLYTRTRMALTPRTRILVKSNVGDVLNEAEILRNEVRTQKGR